MEQEVKIVHEGAKLFLREKTISEMEEFLKEQKVPKEEFSLYFDEIIVRAKYIQEEKWRKQRKYIVFFSSLLLLWFAFKYLFGFVGGYGLSIVGAIGLLWFFQSFGILGNHWRK